ncbi:MAG: helix-turn-helix domain-containing protein [Proteobacteria bacterium]|nr:helix-turn-helix domain-containing protein [Pseudomonadota bacterium]
MQRASVEFDIVRGFFAMTKIEAPMLEAPVLEVLVLTGSMPSSVAITLDVLATANRLQEARGRSPAFIVRLAGSGARMAASMAAGARLSTADSAKCTTKAADAVVVPGLGMSTEEEVTARLARRDAAWAERRLADAVERGAHVATSCSGAFLFAAAGLLDNRRASTTWWLAPLFRRMHPSVVLDPDALVVTDGPVTTAGAAMAQMDLMLAIVARRAGARLADTCARYLLLDKRRSQSRYMALGFLAAADERVARAERWARKRLGEDFTVDDLAAAAALSPRTFARRVERAVGLSPVRFLQRLRVERAVELLETTKLPLDEIARQVGYAEPSTLRRLIHRSGLGSPRRLRATPSPNPSPSRGRGA